MHGGEAGGGHAAAAAAARRPPYAVMCFGLGGQLVVAMPGGRRSLGVFTGSVRPR
jgi:hypothetical protein